MAIKMRVLYYSNKGKMKSFGEAICYKFESKLEVIPPAYPCENERLTIIGATLGKEIPNALRQFCASLNKSKCQNVGFYIDGPKETAVELMNIVRDTGCNVFSDVHYVKGGLPFKFLGSCSEEERKAIVEWTRKMYEEVSQ